MRWMLLLAVSGLACGEQAPSEETPEYPWGPFACGEQASDPLEKTLSTDGTVLKAGLLPSEIGELAAHATGTTPDAVCVRLNGDFDYLLVQAYIRSKGYTSGCQVAEFYRVGPAAQPWAVRDIQRFPLDYAEVLPSGFYTHQVSLWWAGFSTSPSMSMTQPFEVDATGGLRPLTLEEYDLAVTGRRSLSDVYYPSTEPYVPPPPNPCPIPAPYTDVISSETAASRIDVDAWQEVTTIQPLRWYRTVVPERGAPNPPRLGFRARDASGAEIRWEIGVTTDEPAAFESTGGRLILTEPHEPRTRGMTWSGSARNVSVSLDGPTRLRVQLSDIVLEQDDRLATEPGISRTLGSASIVGEWIQQ